MNLHPRCPFADCGDSDTRPATSSELAAAGIDPAWISVYRCSACHGVWIELTSQQIQLVGHVSFGGRGFSPLSQPMNPLRGDVAHVNPKRAP